MIPFDFDSIFTDMTITLPAPHLLQIKVPQHGVDTEQVRSRYGVSQSRYGVSHPIVIFCRHLHSIDHRLTKAIICLFASSIRSSWNGFR